MGDARHEIQTANLLVTTVHSEGEHWSMSGSDTGRVYMVVTPELAAKLKEAAVAKNVTHGALAEALAVSKTTVTNILNGKTRTTALLKPLCELLGVDCGQGLDLDEDQISVLEALEHARAAGLGVEFVKLAQRLSAQLVSPALPLPPQTSDESAPSTRALPAPPISRGSK